MYKQHMVENVLRIQQQMSLIASQEKVLDAEAKALLAKIDRKAARLEAKEADAVGGEKARQLAAKRAKVRILKTMLLALKTLCCLECRRPSLCNSWK